MVIAEITIAVLLGVLLVIGGIYVTYFSITNYKLKVNRLENGDYYPEEKTTKEKVFTISLIAFFVISLFVFSVNITYKCNPFINNQYLVSVNSTSMAAKASGNDYLTNHHLDNQIAQYDVIAFDKYENQEIEKYDIILYKHDNILITHRVINITDEGYITRGDNNTNNDDWVVSDADIMGIYNHKLVFFSFVNYLGYTPGMYVLAIGVTYILGTILFFEYKNDTLNKKASKENLE